MQKRKDEPKTDAISLQIQNHRNKRRLMEMSGLVTNGRFMLI